MAESTSTQTGQESFRCPICLERLNIPRDLPCLHTFCEVCIQTYISSSTTRDEKDEFNVINCPVCRQQVTEPERDISSENWAKSLPLNKWVWTMTINTESDSVKHCMFCKREDLTMLAKHWCTSCAEPICDDCKRIHKRVPILRNHKIVEINDTEKLKEGIDIDENCAIHKGKLLELFCNEHKKLCCSACFAHQHRSCTDFDTIDEIVIKLDKIQIKEKIKSLSSLHDCITEIQEESKKQIESLCSSKEEVCSSFSKQIEEAKMFLDQAHERWRKRFEVEHSHQMDNIDVVSDELKRFNTTVNEAKSILSSVLDSGSDKQMFILHSKIYTQILDHFKCLKALKIWDLAKSYSFETDLLANVTDTMEFGEAITKKRPTYALSRISTIDKTQFGESLPSPKPWLANMDLMNVTFSDMSEIQVEGYAYFGTFIDDGNVVISNESKQTLEIYDTASDEGELIHTHKCPATPYDICHSNDMKRIYVAFGRFVIQYEIKRDSSEFIEVNKIQVEENIEGIARTIDGFFTANKSSVSYRLSDFSIKSHLHCYRKGNRPFICSSFCGRKVAYIDERSIIVTDTEGMKLAEFACSMDCPRGLSFDSDENIVVCSYKGQTEQIKHDGKSRRNLDVNPFDAVPYNVVYHQEGHKLMCFALRTSNNVAIFEVIK